MDSQPHSQIVYPDMPTGPIRHQPAHGNVCICGDRFPCDVWWERARARSLRPHVPVLRERPRTRTLVGGVAVIAVAAGICWLVAFGGGSTSHVDGSRAIGHGPATSGTPTSASTPTAALTPKPSGIGTPVATEGAGQTSEPRPGDAAPNVTGAAGSAPTPHAPVASPVPSRTTSVSSAPSMEDGVFTVGVDIPAGTYVAAYPSLECTWEVTEQLLSKVIQHSADVIKGTQTVKMKSGQDFTTEACGTWIKKGT